MEAAFFDLDKTVIARPSLVAFGRPLYEEGLISRSTVVRALWAQLIYLHVGTSERRLARMRDSVLALSKGWSQARISEIVADTLERVIEPIIFAEAMELIASHRRAGRHVYLISASPSEIVEPLARFLGVDRAIASQARVDDLGRYTGQMEVYAYGPHKAHLVRQVAERDGIDLAGSYAYSDSYTDLPMLEAVGHPVAVNPDRPLLRLARERDWPVRHFVQPVRLRGRRPVTAARAVAAAGGAGLAVAGAAAVAVLLLSGRGRRGPGGAGQATRSLRTATTVSPTRAAMRKSFFMAGHATRWPPGPPGGGRPAGGSPARPSPG